MLRLLTSMKIDKRKKGSRYWESGVYEDAKVMLLSMTEARRVEIGLWLLKLGRRWLALSFMSNSRFSVELD